MATYKLYLLEHPGRVSHVVDLECEDDARAIRAAERKSDGRPMELWLGAHMVRKFSGRLSAQP